jgi:tRNA (guanine-N7-)-methyltransferase
MSRKKRIRFAKNSLNPLVIEPGKEEFLHIRGKWNSSFFRAVQPIVLEIGCGRGEYTVGLARHFPQRHFIGVDIKGSRLWKGAMQALEEGLTNVAFIRNKVENIQQQLAEGEIHEIWITFPDPRPKSRDALRRLTSARFLRLYSMIACKEGLLAHLKTDDAELYQYSKEVLDVLSLPIIASTENLYASDLLEDHRGIQTTYEKRFIAEGKPIHYLKFHIPAHDAPDNPLFKNIVDIPIQRASDIGFYQNVAK